MSTFGPGSTLALRGTDLLSPIVGCSGPFGAMLGPAANQLALVGVTMFGLGTTELLIFMVIVLLVFGSARLPSLMRNLGKSATEFKKGMRDDSDDQPKINGE